MDLMKIYDLSIGEKLTVYKDGSAIISRGGETQTYITAEGFTNLVKILNENYEVVSSVKLKEK